MKHFIFLLKVVSRKNIRVYDAISLFADEPGAFKTSAQGGYAILSLEHQEQQRQEEKAWELSVLCRILDFLPSAFQQRKRNRWKKKNKTKKNKTGIAKADCSEKAYTTLYSALSEFCGFGPFHYWLSDTNSSRSKKVGLAIAISSEMTLAHDFKWRES